MKFNHLLEPFPELFCPCNKGFHQDYVPLVSHSHCILFMVYASLQQKRTDANIMERSWDAIQYYKEKYDVYSASIGENL